MSDWNALADTLAGIVEAMRGGDDPRPEPEDDDCDDVTPDPACDRDEPRHLDPVQEFIGRMIRGTALERTRLAKKAVEDANFKADVVLALKVPHVYNYPTKGHK